MATATKSKREAFAFTLILSGCSKVTASLEDALFESGCEDALLGIRDGVIFLDFEREGADFFATVTAAIRQVDSAGAGVHVVRVEPDDLVNASEIARRVQRSRESVRLLAQGARGPGGFPPPVSTLSGQWVWRWADVAGWFANTGEVTDQVARRAELIATINRTLELRRHVSTKSAMMNVWNQLQASKSAKPTNSQSGSKKRRPPGRKK